MSLTLLCPRPGVPGDSDARPAASAKSPPVHCRV